MAIRPLQASTLGSPSLYTAPPEEPERTPFTGSLTGNNDAPPNPANYPTPPPAQPSLPDIYSQGTSGYPSMTPQQAYNTRNFYYGDAPGGADLTEGANGPGTVASSSALSGDPMTDTYGGGGSTALDMMPGQHGLADARYTTLGGVGPGASVAQDLAKNLNLQAYGSELRTAPQIDMGATNFFAAGTGNALQHADSTNLLSEQALANANGTNLYGVRQGLDLAGTATGPAQQGQMNAANMLYGASAGQAAMGGLSTAQQLATAANGPGYTGQLAAAQQLGQAANGPAYTNMMGSGDQLSRISQQGGLNTGANLLDAAYGSGVNNQNAIAGQMAGLANSGNTVSQQQLAQQMAGTSYAPEVLNQNALAQQLAGSINSPLAANQANLAARLAGTANGPTTTGQLSLADQLAAIGRAPAGPSVAQQQLKMGADAAMKQQMAMASAARGGNTALALQNAGANQGEIMGQLNQQQALLRAQEDMANRQLAAQTTQGAAGIYGNVQGQQAQALAAGAGLYGNLQGQQAAALQGAAGVYGSSLGQQQQGLSAASDMYGNVQGQQLGALQGAAGTYGNAAGLQGSLLGAAAQTDLANRGLQVNAAQGAGSVYGQAGGLQGAMLGASGNAYQSAAQTQGQLLGAANQGYTSTGQLQGSLLGAASQGYAGAAGTQQNAYQGAGQIFGNVANNQVAQGAQYGAIANNQLGQANTVADLTKMYGGLATNQASLNQNQTQMNDQKSLALQGQAINTLGDQTNREMNLVNQNIQSQNTRYGIEEGVAINQANLNQQADQANMGAALGAGGTLLSMIPLLAMSDIRAKTKIAPASGEVADAFRPLSSSSYLYKNPYDEGAEEGTQYGPMAQQLEQTPAGSTAVRELPNGKKGIDTGRLALMNASATSDMMRRLDAVEGQAAAISGTAVPMPTTVSTSAAPSLYAQPTRAPMIAQLPSTGGAPPAISARAPMMTSAPPPGAFAQYGAPVFDGSSVLPSAAPTVAVNDYAAARASKKKKAKLLADSPFGWTVPPPRAAQPQPSLYGPV